MFKIKNSTIHCSRGEKGTIHLRLPITDTNNYIKYENKDNNTYWYDSDGDILYDSNYVEISDIEIASLSMVYYQFQIGDKVKLNVYNKKGYDKSPVMTKETVVEATSDGIDIILTEEDTTFGNQINKETVFWYDVTLNDDLTVVCYDEEGAKEFILYPAKGADE